MYFRRESVIWNFVGGNIEKLAAILLAILFVQKWLHIAISEFLEPENIAGHRNRYYTFCISVDVVIWNFVGGHIGKLAVILAAILFICKKIDYILLLLNSSTLLL